MPPNDPNTDNDAILEQIRDLQNELEKAREQIRLLGTDVGELSQEIRKTYQALQEQIEESLKTSFSNSQVQSSVQRALTALGSLAGEAFSRALNTAVERGIGDINVGQMETTLGAMSSSIANIVGILVGGTTAAYTANPAAVVAAGGAAQQLTSQIVNAVGMQLEGYRMMGARVLPLTGQDFMQYAQDLSGVGAEYQRTLSEMRQSTGASEQETAQLIRTLAQLGIGFLEGSRDIIQYNTALERMLVLRPGTILQTETALVKEFGQSINDIKPIMEGMIEAVRRYQNEYKNLGNTTAGAFQSMQLFHDALMQTTSAARTSGASLDTLLTLSQSLMDTMITGEGKGLFRPEHIVQGAGSILQILTPSGKGTITAGAPMQGAIMTVIQQTEFGKNLLQRFQEIQKERGLAPGPAQLGLAAEYYIRSGNMQERGLQYAFSVLSGLQQMIQQGPQGKTAVSLLLGNLNVDQREAEMLFQHIDDLTRRGVFSAQDPFALYKELVAKKDLTPQSLELSRKIVETAGQVAPETLSAMDKAALELTKLSTYFAGGEYLRDSRDIVQFMRGIETGTAALARGASEPEILSPYGVSSMVGAELQRLSDEPKSPAVLVEPEVSEETSQDYAIAEDKMCFPPELVNALEGQKTAMNSGLCNAGTDY